MTLYPVRSSMTLTMAVYFMDITDLVNITARRQEQGSNFTTATTANTVTSSAFARDAL